ncbi:acyl-CoA dehydratase activase-related protein [Thermoanaerobacterium sp. DL9XJH110]|uniref:acyl-CoA dehydratase activase-related protein n=1 Tax=Thermoanaerobacterium sp. DL9XJH110 TaxID=3386643 RepID=UPI003BB7C7FB
MKITFPHMGNIYIPIKTFFEQLGVEVIVPPICNKRTLELGVKHSPEFACLPLKINIGNFIESLEKGADVIVMAGGSGPCRFGYYAQVQREILKDLGFHFDMVVLEPPRGHLLELIQKLGRIVNKKNRTFKEIVNAGKLAWQKAILLDELDRMASKTRPLELNKGDTERKYDEAMKLIEKARNEAEMGDVKREIQEMFLSIKVDGSRIPVKIGLAGEIYTVLEPFVNLYIEKQLGELGVEVRRSIYITDWFRENIFPSFLKPKEHAEILKLASPYINCFVGGHGRETVAEVVRFSREGFEGVIQLLPFTCMPEIVAKSVLPNVSRKYSIPVMTLVLDEHSAEAGFRTRLEAFVDMIRHRSEVDIHDKMFAGN